MIRTLIVDDDFRVAAIHRSFTERVEGFSVVGEAHTGAAALEQASRLRPDLVLLDIYLPDMAGLEVARRLGEPGHPAVDVIAVTAARDAATVHAAIQGGALHYLVKPFTFATFREKLDRYAAWRVQLGLVGLADQRDVDRLYGVLRAQGSPMLPKGLSGTTLDLVQHVLRGAGGDLSATDVAAAAGVSRVTARRYLDHLRATGRVELRLQYGNAGRPEHRYRLAAGALPAG
jgi:two-component system CitB family response regulator